VLRRADAGKAGVLLWVPGRLLALRRRWWPAAIPAGVDSASG